MLSVNITGCPEPLPASASGGPAAAAAAVSAANQTRPDAAAGPAPPLSGLGAAVEAALSALAARVAAVPLSVPLVGAPDLDDLSRPFSEVLDPESELV